MKRLTPLAFFLFLSGSVLAQTPSQGQRPGQDMPNSTPDAYTNPDTTNHSATNSKSMSSLSRDDRQFLRKATEAGMTEVAAGQLAEAQGGDPSVKAFGKQVVDDQTPVNEELEQLAQSKGLSSGNSASRSTPKQVRQLKSAQGTAFDKSYAQQEVKDHETAIALYEKAEKSKDPDIAAFAQKNLPTLEHHLEMAKALP
jgi:putative membrane protein